MPQSVAAAVAAGPRGVRTPPLWVDRVLGSDPGATRLRSAGLAVLSIGSAMLVEWWFARTTHALQLSADDPALRALPAAARAATLAAQHHAITVIAIMLGAIVGLVSSFGANMFPARATHVIATVLIPVPMTAGISVGLVLGDHRVLALGLLVVVLTAGQYARRYGPLGFLGGQLAFMGSFFGFNLHGDVPESGIGWLVAEIAIGAGVALLAQFTVFFPSRSRALRRMVRSYMARERELAAAALRSFDEPSSEAAARRVRRRAVRLNESALMIDAQLAAPGSVPEHWDPAELHQRLFDSELALTNMARFAGRLGDAGLPERLRSIVRDMLVAVEGRDLLTASRGSRALLRALSGGDDGVSDTVVVWLHRFAVSVGGFVDAAEGWRIAVLTTASRGSRADYRTDVTLTGGWLPGSSAVSATASLEAGARRTDRVRLEPFTRIAIQMAVASTLAVVLGSWLSEKRFYWAVIATFVTFLGANNAGEQLRKGFFRVIGTVAGVFLGAVLVHVTGQSTVGTIVVVLVALFFGLYLLRISYAFMTIGITIMVSQLYVQLDEYSTSLLVLRLEETAIGAACAALTVLLVIPLRTGRVVRVATRQYVQALSAFVQAAVSRLGDPAFETELREAARQIDSAYQALQSTLVPMNTPAPGQPGVLRKRIAYTVAGSRHYARNLVVDARAEAVVPVAVRPLLARAGERLLSSLDEIVAVGLDADPAQHTYVRASSLFEQVNGQLGEQLVTSPAHLALRDLQLIDGAMAGLAEAIGMPVTSLDDGPDAPAEVMPTARRSAEGPAQAATSG